jgi:magnesium transporter
MARPTPADPRQGRDSTPEPTAPATTPAPVQEPAQEAAVSAMSSIRAAGARVRRPAVRPAVPAKGPLPVPISAYIVDCAVYVDGHRLPGQWTHTDAIAEVRRRGQGFVWIGLHGPSAEQIQGIADEFGLHELAVEDAVHGHQRPKLERYGDTLFMVLKTVCYVQHVSPDTANEIVATGELMVFVGHNFVVTVRRGQHSGLGTVRQYLQAHPEQLALGPAAVLHAIADYVVDSYLDVTDRIEDDIDELEENIFQPRSAVPAEVIYLMKHEVTELRRSVVPLTTPLRRLAEGYTPLVPDEVRLHFRNVDDHLTTVAERVNAYDELLTTLVQAVLAKITLQQNNDMRKIAAWVAIISVPTMVAGIYGMNFDYMPELHWKFGYPLVVGFVAAVCVTLFRIFRRNGWL